MDAARVQWVNEWLDAVVTGQATMSQRSQKSIDKHGVDVEALVPAGQGQGRVHLLQLTDDRGEVLYANSLNPFKILA